MAYDRQKAVAYAREWAFKRNPKYYNFDPIGGDCTNFVSQCLYAGCGVMNYTRTFGWYYRTGNDKAPAWTGVPYLYKFLVNNAGPGPYGRELPLREAVVGDIVQLNFTGDVYGHSLLIVEIDGEPVPANIKVAAHTNDAYGRALDTYWSQQRRLIHIDGARG